MWESGDRTIKCPCCGKSTIKVFRRPSRLDDKTTHISAGSKTIYYRVPESYEILSGCSACGRSRKEVQKAFDTGVTTELSHEERLKRLREAGLALRIATKHKKEATV